MRYTFTSHKKYNDSGTHEPFDMFKGTAAAGLDDCHKETEAFAKEQDHLIPANTRSNPADRVKRIREGLAWSRLADTQAAIRSSVIYKKSAVLFFHCVLSSVYGEPVTLEIHTFDGLNKEGKYPGREYFLKEMQKALYGEEQERYGMKIDRQKIIYLYQGKKMIGLMSANGPIPAINYEPPFPFNTLPIDDTEGTASITEALEDQDKQIVQYWLSKNPELVKTCDLFRDISSDLKNVGIDAKIERNLTIARTETEFPNFPYLKNYDGELLADSITIVPLSDDKSPLGYNMPTQMLKKDGKPYKIKDYCYGFIPPLSQQAVEWTRNDAFEIRSFTVPEKGITIEDNKLGTVQVDCKITVDGLDITVSKVYEYEQLRYVKQFPAFSVYGPVPKFGWIAQRNEKPEREYASPLINNTVSRIDGLNDIELEGIRFELIEDNYLLYCGEIPQWAGIRGNGNWLGALPLRVDVGDKMQTDWKEAPAFVHKTLPPRKKMKVAVDIGSSRSVVLFLKDLEDDNSTEYTLIEKDQSLRVDLTSTLGKGDNSDKFNNALFQPDKEYRKITGKTPLAVFRTAKFSTDTSGTDPVLLYRLGKLAFLDSQQFASARSKDYDSNIKAQIKPKMQKNNEKNNEKNKAMMILVQGLLTVIIERAIHLGCCDIDIRTAYLVEQYNVMGDIWKDAVKAIVSRMPEDIKKLINISVDLCLPESLAIANRISHTNQFEAGSGAAFVDIGDFSTDIALFQHNDKTDTKVKLINNFSIHFAGAEILLRPIWDYLCMSQTVEFKNIFTLPEKEDEFIDMVVVKELTDERQKQMSSNSIDVGQDKVKSGLLCLMNKLKPLDPKVAKDGSDGKKLENLYNLFDLGYLAEILLLKRLIKDVPVSGGRFNIHLFGGGSSYFREQKDSYNWSDVLGRPCETYNKSKDGDILALGLLRGKGEEEVHSDIWETAKDKNDKASSYCSGEQLPKIPDNDEELKQGYIQFVMEIRNLKGDGWHIWQNNTNVSASPKDEAPDKNLLRIFNVRKTQKDGHYVLDDDNDAWTKKLDAAKKFAKICLKDCPTEDTEIFKVLFAYKMAYLCIMDVYSGK